MNKKVLGVILIIVIVISSVSAFVMYRIFSKNSDAFTEELVLNVSNENDLDGKFILTWDSKDWSISYKLYRSTSPIDKQSLISADLIISTESTTYNEELSIPDYYYYLVKAEGANSQIGLSNCVRVNVSFPVDCPVLDELPITNEGGTFDISWIAVENASFYYLYRSNVENPSTEDYDLINESTDTIYHEISLDPGFYSYYAIASNGEKNTSDSESVNIQVFPSYEDIRLDGFPFSLDLLFQNDNPAVKASRLSSISGKYTDNGTPFIDPYPNYWHYDHYPATLKWYVYALRYLPISLPIDSYITISGTSAITDIINGSTIIKNVGVTLHLDYNIRIIFEHMCVNETIFNQIDASVPESIFYGAPPTKHLFLPANTVFGFTHDAYALDFIVDDSKHKNFNGSVSYGLETMRNPYTIFSESMQSTIDLYYQDQLNAMVASGNYIQGYLNHTFDVNEDHSIFGSWWYKDGWFDLDSSHHTMGWYAFDGCILNLLNINKTSSETFTSYSEGCIGMYSDAEYPASVDGYEVNGTSYMYYVEGANFTEVIVNLDHFPVGSYDQFVRIKLVDNNVEDLWDDELWVQYYADLTSAQLGFDDKKIVYERIPSNVY